MPKLPPRPDAPDDPSLPHAFQLLDNTESASGATDASGVFGSSQSVAPRMADTSGCSIMCSRGKVHWIISYTFRKLNCGYRANNESH